jgi:hypothetical protein
MGLFSRKTREPETVTVDWDAARRAGEAVNRGDHDEANRIVAATDHPRETVLATFRFIKDDES